VSRKDISVGVLGAAAIVPSALIEPARELPGIRVAAIAARQVQRARELADRLGIERAYGGYDDLLADDDLDLIYVALPAALHAKWAIRALRAGRNVLVEKPFASTAAGAAEIVAGAQVTQRLAVEAMHWVYHPLARHLRDLLQSGALGTPDKFEGRFVAPIANPGDIRRRMDLGGGAALDLLCYPIHWAQHLLEDGLTVVSAAARHANGIDEEMQAVLRAGPTEVEISCSISGDAAFEAWLRIIGSRGQLHVVNPLVPHFGHQVSLEIVGEAPQRLTIPGRSTYHHQLAAVAERLRGGGPLITEGGPVVARARLMDRIYALAGLPARASN
jgi:predicted dehydrogenase